MIELFGTPEALHRYAALSRSASEAGIEVSPVDGEALAVLADTVQPQGIVALCHQTDVPLPDALARGPKLVAALAEIRDPGNAGTVLRTADAAGAGAVVFAGDAVDPYNGKCVRSTAGSLFHVDVVRAPDPVAVVREARAGGLTVLAATGYGDADLDALADEGALAVRTMWIFGSEAHGLSEAVLEAADLRVKVPMHGRAESLNLAAAAAVCLYASARALRDFKE
ncbi:TrmH family RNA methyltransferase [Catenuloplanes nepalensis]|uniref:TrmH family RNA methyltransferase n=1 Tax=Catenuloplanes nepalensis TaxID=587533 RepID=A0ABT9MWZ1_9ACTN|nr:TrmH family RNA methyltransferase [Catenuloplanes nepalensis]